MVLKLYSGGSFQLQTFLHQCNIQTELLLSQQALQNPLCRKYFDKYLTKWGAVLMCQLEWAWIFVTVNLPTSSFGLKLEQPVLVCLVRKKSRLGVMSRGKLEAYSFLFRRRLLDQTCLPHATRKTSVVGNRRSNMEHQKTGDFGSCFVSQLSLLEPSITHWIKRKLPAAQLRFHPVCSWSDSKKFGF